jgi:hypothetical protein
MVRSGLTKNLTDVLRTSMACDNLALILHAGRAENQHIFYLIDIYYAPCKDTTAPIVQMRKRRPSKEGIFGNALRLFRNSSTLLSLGKRGLEDALKSCYILFCFCQPLMQQLTVPWVLTCIGIALQPGQLCINGICTSALQLSNFFFTFYFPHVFSWLFLSSPCFLSMFLAYS